MNSLDKQETAALGLALLGSIYIAYKVVGPSSTTPSAIYTLRGPESPSWLSGNNEAARTPFPSNTTFESWMREYGTTFPLHGFFGSKELFIADTQAIAFVLNQPLDFPKTRMVLNMSRNFMGDGLVVAEGAEHKRQRKILNPAFGVAAMRDITPMLMEVAHELRDVWKKSLSGSNSGPPWQEIDVLPWLSNTALDMIGLAGFGYKFESLHDSSNELGSAFRAFSTGISLIKGMGMLTMFFPSLRRLPIGSNVVNNRSREVMDRVGDQMVKDKKAEVEQLGESSSSEGRDLLGVLIRANLKEHAADRLDDKTLRAEISTFLLAGHETTAIAMTWGLDALAKNPGVQSKLRDEALAFPNDSPSMEDLNAMPYLNNVVKEILRLRTPLIGIRRTARSDTIVPLAQPIVDKNGKKVHEIFLRAGDSVLLHTYALNTRQDLWGSDALSFRPERYEELSDGVSDIPSMWGNVTSFSAGPRGCIGWRMAVLEIKALLFTLLREFQFDIDPKLVITGVVT
ncbi:hypothetical protein FRB97_009349 [Tulasnella sp. 331]|nr:hypothetical protein FRB97_009349 [Tulasnella sp. 331]KAG8889198.1 hypothetical protein FRB98_005391 [Tulasnella sp. 332]